MRAADSAGLTYVSDTEPGFRRRGKANRFSYTDEHGKVLRDPRVLSRIRSLVVPPAWKDVWICKDSHGHIQATGRDSRGRKQYIYHPNWRVIRDGHKFDHILDFAKVLPSIREHVAKHMRRRETDRQKVLATVVQLLDTTLIRVGNADYAAQNKSYGLTTLRDRHAVINGTALEFQFTGKSGKSWRLKLRDRRITRAVKDCQDIPGQHLFQYFDDAGERRPVTSSDVNAYLRKISGEDITAKDFRTWAGTVLAATELSQHEPFSSRSEATRKLSAAIKNVADRLGNTPTVCRKCYVHPVLFDCYLEGCLPTEIQKRVRRHGRGGSKWLEPEEAAVLALLKTRLRGF